MKKLGRILLKDWYLIILIVAMVVTQAYCELTLPQYTSNIVNVGIQQSGVETHVPTIIRTSSMEKLYFFMAEDDIKVVEQYFERVEENSVAYMKRLKLDKKQEKEIIAQLEEIFRMPMLFVYAMENIDANSDLAASTGLFPEGGIDPTNPEAIKQMEEAFAQLDSSMFSQIAINYVINEYKQINLDIEKIRSDYMARTGGIMVLYALFAAISTAVATFLSSRMGARFARDTRSSLFRHITNFSNKEFDDFSTATLITRSTNDVQQVQVLISMMLRLILFAPIMGFGALAKVLGGGYSLAWIIGLAVITILVVIIALFIFVMPKFQKIQKLVDRLNLVAREVLTGLPVIRAFSREDYEKKRFDAANMDLTKVSIFVNRAMSIMMPTMMFIMNGTAILIVWFGAKSIDIGGMQVGDLLALISYSMNVIMSFLVIAMLSVMLPRAIISAKRIGEVLDEKTSVNDPVSPKPFSGKHKGKIEFKNVSFRYENADENVLDNISFVSNPGETTAIIGSTGSGKSTLVNLIPRFFDVTEGEILLEGTNIKDITMHDLREQIGYIPQKAVLFSGTIRSNIAFSDESMSDENVRNAAEIAQAHDFIEEKEDKYDSSISQGGTNVSGGQRQRLSIARAIAKQPAVYIFDDSFSALDYKTDVMLRRALAKTLTDSTVLIVAQRISTVINADRIIVLDEGKVAGMGTHQELLESCEVYRDIAYSQLSASELERKEG